MVLALGMTSEKYMLERVLWVGVVIVSHRGPAIWSIQVAVVCGIRGFGNKTDGTVIDCI